MKVIGTGKLSGSEGQKVIFDGFQIGAEQQLERKTYELSIPFKNTDVGAQDLTEAGVLAALAVLFGKNTIRFGEQETADFQFESAPFDHLRKYAAYMDELDFSYVNHSGALIRFGDSPATAVYGSMPAGETHAVIVHVQVPYILKRAGTAMRDGCPGETQMKNCYVEIERAAGFNSGAKVGTYFIQDGDVGIVVRGDTFDGSDAWHRPPRFFTDPNADKQESRGPGGKLLLVLETRAAAASNDMGAIDLVTLRRGSDGRRQKDPHPRQRGRDGAPQRRRPLRPARRAGPGQVRARRVRAAARPAVRRVAARAEALRPPALDLAADAPAHVPPHPGRPGPSSRTSSRRTRPR
jgi:hypothetical protein